jgi:hypothetical protein
MKSGRSLSVLFLEVIFSLQSVSQDWPKIYLQNIMTYPFAVIENYDHGFIIGGEFSLNNTSDGGLIFKTNINGEMLWSKRVGLSFDGASIHDINQTLDGGLILTGSTNHFDSWGDPYILKLNSCGETEWCRIYTELTDTPDFGGVIHQMPGGYIALFTKAGYLFANDHIKLFRLDENGNLIWEQLYAQSDSLILAGSGYDMIITSDYNFLITGDCYFPDSGTTNPKYLRPFIIKVDSNGEVDWELPWSYLNGTSFGGQSFRSIVDNNKSIYSCGRHIIPSGTNWGDKPTMIKTDSSGNEISFKDIFNNTWQAVMFNLNWIADSTIEIDGGWIYGPGQDGHVGVLKLDRFGNVLDSNVLLTSYYCFADAIKTFDNKIFLVSPQYNNFWNTYAWKLNSDLDFDTLYTYPFVYDSLCPHPIVSDTIPLDCVVVGTEEPVKKPETTGLKVYPNPTSEKVTIVFPEHIRTNSMNPVYSLTTIYHQWQTTMLEVYDLYGRKIIEKEIPKSQTRLELDVSHWNKGMYIFRLVYNKETVASEKVIVE